MRHRDLDFERQPRQIDSGCPGLTRRDAHFNDMLTRARTSAGRWLRRVFRAEAGVMKDGVRQGSAC